MKNNLGGFVPVHSLGISQIVSYGTMFYSFAQIKVELAEKLGLTLETTTMIVSLALFINVLISSYVGYLIDRYGGLKVLSNGLFIGSIGFITLFFTNSFLGFLFSMLLIGISFSSTTYNVAFSAAIQIDDQNSRKNITIITFYGAIASSVCWITIGFLRSYFGLNSIFLMLSLFLFLMGLYFLIKMNVQKKEKKNNPKKQIEDLVPLALSQKEKVIIAILMIFGFTEYLIFSTTALSLINFFTSNFNDPSVAIILASTYGPFQLVGRFLEMRFATFLDARLTGLIASTIVPISLIIILIPDFYICIIAMALFGMGHGLLTVTGGYVPNLFFEPRVIGRVKGYIWAPTALGMSCAPFLSGVFYENMNNLIIFLLALSVCPILSLLFIFKMQTRF
jgi:MFS family permease